MQTTIPLYGFGSGSGGTGATLTVTAPAGATVTISKDGKTKTKVADASGIAVFKGLESGEWTVVISDGSQTSAPKTVTITADYSTAMSFFAATINVTYPAGSTCTATDGVTTLTAPDTSGTWACVVPNAGTWTIRTDEITEDVDVTISGEIVDTSVLYLYKDGKTGRLAPNGFKQKDGFVSGWGTKDPPVFGTEKITVSVPNTGNTTSVVETVDAIDLSAYSQIIFDVDVISYGESAQMGLSIGNNGLGSTIVRQDISELGRYKTTVDISSVTGSNHIYFAAWINGTADLYSVKLIK